MISIIIPIYNAELYLVECLRSLQSQTYKNIEIILVDDGSTDNSRSICEKYAKRDQRIHLYSQENVGVSVARNKGLSVAKGNYICFVDADDVVAPDYLSHLMELSKDGSFPVCGYTRDEKEIGSGCKSVTQYRAKDFIVRILEESTDHPNIWMMLFKRSIIQKNKIKFTEGCVRNEDTEFFINYLTYEQTIKVSQYRAYYYRPNPTSAMGAPITVKALTSIEASRRINKLLVEKGIISDESIVLSNGVLTYAYALSKSRNVELYDYLHKKYNVSFAMKRMLTFPRISKRFVAFIYLILGKSLFFKFIGFQRLFR